MTDLIQVRVSKVFRRNYEAYLSGVTVICNEGGSRSGKTYSIIQLLIHLARDLGKRVSIVSHSLPHIKRGVLRDFKAIMETMQEWDDSRWRATDFIYTYPGGGYVELFGLEDEGKARGPGRDILFINEANLVSRMLYDQLAMRTTGTIFMDWNPAEFNSWVYQLADDIRNARIHSTYKDNIQNLSPAQIATIEAYKLLPDDFMWNVYGLGLRGAAKELIYTKYMLYDDEPEGETCYGLDFGYTNPCALVKVTRQEGGNYVQELMYQAGLTVPEMIQMIKSHVPYAAPIYCDSAEPKTIEELSRAGLNAIGADKDVWAGILSVKSSPLYIHRKSKHIIAEIRSYKWRSNRDGELIEEPVKSNDHTMDAVRYAIHTHSTRPRFQIIVA